MQSCLKFSNNSLYVWPYLASTVNWETYLAVDVKIFGKLVEVVLEYAVDEVAFVFDPGKQRSLSGSNRSFSAILVEVRSPNACT